MDRRFRYFLFENYDPEQVGPGQEEPRALLGPGLDAVLSRAVDFFPGRCPRALLEDEFSPELISRLISAGLFRAEGSRVWFDTPIFLRSDAPILAAWLWEQAPRLTARLAEHWARLRELACSIQNDFPPEVNLYHVLCGMVFDGLFLDRLSQGGVLASSRVHGDGLDYLTILYEDCPELNALSDGLLCSWNRFGDGQTTLQTFGDSAGVRWDLYRFARLREQGCLNGRFQQVQERFGPYLDEAGRAGVLAQVRLLADTGRCHPTCIGLLERFGYCQDGALCVPVFRREDQATVRAVAALVEQVLYEETGRVLSAARHELDLTAVAHRVPAGEVANELYHLLFGSVNEALVSQGLVAAPPTRAGEGRYLRSVQLF